MNKTIQNIEELLEKYEGMFDSGVTAVDLYSVIMDLGYILHLAEKEAV